MAKGHRLCVLLFVAVYLLGVSSEVMTGMRRFVRSRSRSGCQRMNLENGNTRLVSGGRVMSFRCNNGLRLVGTVTAMCTPSGKWNKEPPICVAPGCPDVLTSLPTNLRVKNIRYSGALISFTCDGNFTMTGSEKIFCNGNEWNDTVPMCYASPTPATTLHSCNFERNRCGWSQSSDDDFNWTRGSGETPTSRTGPSMDHTRGNSKGHFLFIESSSPQKYGHSAVLISPNFAATWSGNCFQFWYHMFNGVPVMNDFAMGSLEVFVSKAGDSLSRLSPSFLIQGNQRDSWHLGQIKIPTLTTSFQIVMNATRGTSFYSDIAIDDVTLFRCSKGGTTTQSTSTVTCPTSQATTTPPMETTNALTTTTEVVESTKTILQRTTTEKDTPVKGAVGKPNAGGGKISSPAVFGKTAASKEDENNESLVPIIIGVSGGVGVVVIVAVIAIIVSRMTKRKRDGAKTHSVADDHIYVTPNPPSSFDSSPRSSTLEVCNVTYMSMP